MTAVASPPSLQPLGSLSWNSSEGGFSSMSRTDDIGRVLGRAPQRNASSTIEQKDGGPRDDKVDEKPRPLWPAAVKSEPTVSLTPSTSNNKPADTFPSIPQNQKTSSIVNGILPPPKSIINGNMQGPPVNGKVTPPPPPPPGSSEPPIMLVLLPMNGTFERKQISVPIFPEVLRIGRQTNPKTVPTPVNGYFDSKVLSRQHAEIWAERHGKIWIRDVKSSNGTFVNGQRLSPENRDSEPHELRENDMLELGIDIVSEDQKSIVHHKVSAKVEHAGFQSNQSSVLDLSVDDIDPAGSAANPLFPQGQRPRADSSSSLASIKTDMNGGHGGLQRHATAWIAPVSIEQLVKRLGNELKSAKQQTQDLQRTSDFFSSVLGPEAVPTRSKTNGVMRKKTLSKPLSQAPVPPPSQPLPEKPNVPKSIHSNPNSKNPSPVSPTKLTNSSSQMLSMTEALAAARKEIEAQGNRVKHLEEMLRKERSEREDAESKSRDIEDKRRYMDISGEMKEGVNGDLSEPSNEAANAAESDQPNGDKSSEPQSAKDLKRRKKKLDGAEQIWQDRLDRVLIDFEEANEDMMRHKKKREEAEAERDALAETVVKLKTRLGDDVDLDEKGGPKKFSVPLDLKFDLNSEGLRKLRPGRKDDSSDGAGTLEDEKDGLHAGINGSAAPAAKTDKAVQKDGDGENKANGAAVPPNAELQQLQGAVMTALAKGPKSNPALVAVPLASVLGIVILGVGMMAYLNGAQGNAPVM